MERSSGRLRQLEQPISTADKETGQCKYRVCSHRMRTNYRGNRKLESEIPRGYLILASRFTAFDPKFVNPRHDVHARAGAPTRRPSASSSPLRPEYSKAGGCHLLMVTGQAGGPSLIIKALSANLDHIFGETMCNPREFDLQRAGSPAIIPESKRRRPKVH